ncbi:hypothetical protein BHS07_18175 [Myxococcus xanthus]|nr:hypothetical protein BHS07_18175 [Myxococcus xanthus]
MTAVPYYMISVEDGDADASLRKAFPQCVFGVSGVRVERLGEKWQPLCHADGSDCDKRWALPAAQNDHVYDYGSTLPTCSDGETLEFHLQSPGDPVLMVERPGK